MSLERTEQIYTTANSAGKIKYTFIFDLATPYTCIISAYTNRAREKLEKRKENSFEPDSNQRPEKN